MKVPPIEKIPEAYSAIIDNRIMLHDNDAIVKSSDMTKEYYVKWKDNIYYSNDNATYWQSYPGYPIIAVLMLQNKLPLDMMVAEKFKGINWNIINKENKRDYQKSLNQVLSDISSNEKDKIISEINKVYENLLKCDLIITKKKNLD